MEIQNCDIEFVEHTVKDKVEKIALKQSIGTVFQIISV